MGQCPRVPLMCDCRRMGSERLASEDAFCAGTGVWMSGAAPVPWPLLRPVLSGVPGAPRLAGWPGGGTAANLASPAFLFLFIWGLILAPLKHSVSSCLCH